ncbi:hypothetical protein, partial [Streptomyces silvensis]|uniref:hypothetical protein n=1 Tax=Streptomyces silvensis TaxID=1765722 RepID=UPI001A7E1838
MPSIVTPDRCDFRGGVRWGTTGVRGDVRAAAGHLRSMREIVKWLTTTDHKRIGTLYLVTSFAFF